MKLFGQEYGMYSLKLSSNKKIVFLFSDYQSLRMTLKKKVTTIISFTMMLCKNLLSSRWFFVLAKTDSYSQRDWGSFWAHSCSFSDAVFILHAALSSYKYWKFRAVLFRPTHGNAAWWSLPKGTLVSDHLPQGSIFVILKIKIHC